jgi:adenosylcobyric acid synthase
VGVDGYEIHVGETTLGSEATPFAWLSQRNREAVREADGAVSPDGRVWGSYLHGIFDAPAYRDALLSELSSNYVAEDAEHAARFKQQEYDKLGAHFEEYVDMDRLLGLG